MTHTLEIMNLEKRFTEFFLQNISFSLPAGYIMGLIGPNGAGKTTIIKLILNMLKKDGGGIRLFGMDHIEHEQEVKERIGVVMDAPFYVDDWQLLDVEKSLAPFYVQWNSRTFCRLLDDFSLDPKKKVKELSRGMKLKLMIAAALSHEADFLILDEPTSGLDAVAREELMDILSAFISDESKAVLFSTHITADLEKIADYITFIHNGEVRYTGTKDNLLEKYALIKGGLQSFTSEQKKRIIGYRETGFGFDGLIETSDLRLFPDSLVAEPCHLDDIVVKFHGERREHV